MKFYKNNAYPEIFLHDCQFKMEYTNNNLNLLFDNGFCRQNIGMTKAKSRIQVSDISLDEVRIRIFKYKTILGKFKVIGKDLEFSELDVFFKNYSLEIVDEYYRYGEFLYKCTPYPYSSNQPFDLLELVVTHEERPIEYYL